MKKYAIYIILIAAACIYRLGVDNYYLGYYNDDAAYILRSESILSSFIKQIHHPLVKPIVSVGLPLLLLPITLISHLLKYDFYQLFMFLVTLFSVYTLYYWLLQEADYFLVIITCLFFLFCPLFAWQPTKVMTEVPFTLFCILTWIILNKARYKVAEVTNYRRQNFYSWLALMLSIFCFLIRPEGFLVVLITVFFLGKDSQKITRNSLLITGIIILVIASFTFKTWGSVMEVYFSEFYAQYSQDLGSIFGNIFWNIKYFFKVVMDSQIFYWEIIPQGKLLAPLFDTLIIWLMVMGIYQEIKNHSLKPEFLFFIGYVIWHLLWIAHDRRYWIPILPYFIYYLIKGSNFVGQKYKVITTFFIIMLGLNILKPNYDMIKRALVAPAQPNWNTYQWINTNLNRKDSMSSYTIFRDYFHTRRLFVNLPEGIEPTTVVERLKNNKIKYIFIDLEVNPGYTYSRKTISDHPRPKELATYIEKDSLIKKIYENKEENTLVYQIYPPSHKAIPIYRGG